MKKQLALFVLGAALSVGLTLAQEPAAPAAATQAKGAHRPDPARELSRLTKKLNLTSDQQTQLLPILTDRQQQLGAIVSDSSLSSKDRHAKVQALRADSDTKIKAVLSDTQKQQYEQMQQQMRERRGHHESKSNS
jgi:Spy/CpxP family protein refolding chaperone